MSKGLSILPKGALDFLSLGALVHRLDPGIVPFRKATECRIHVSGGEFNCAANLSDCFRLNTGIATALVEYPIGDLIAERVRAMGVKPFYKKFKHDGVRGPNHATVYSDQGHGVRAPVVFYNRCNEAGSLLKPGDFNWKEIFGPGVRWFHSGGIFASLSETTGPLIIEAMKAAKAAGAVTSFDLNFRQKLWDIWGGQAKALSVMKGIAEHVDVLVGNEEDLQKGLGLKGPDVTAKSKLDPSVFFGMIDSVVKNYPKVKVVATTLREVHSTNAVATPVFRRKQSDRLAAQLNSPPLTWMLQWVALRNGMTPGSRRWTSAPRDRKSSAPFLGMFKPLLMVLF